MAIIVSRAVGVDTTANQPAAATANRLYVHTTSGSKLYLPEIDDGSAWQPWRSNTLVPMFVASQGTTYVWTPGTSYASFGGANTVNSLLMDFVRFRQARLSVRAQLAAALLGDISMKVVDLTNTQDITGVIVFGNDGNWERQTSSWTNLNAATYGGDALFELQGLSDNDALKQITVGSVTLELR